ncbi:MAG: DeoR/GlpR family DNA-binding transcription regulator [Spirochaetes bacterium]|nr:DeoR/GlpR family DNA-binding transcription regulator [Spirochaetota bacterium]
MNRSERLSYILRILETDKASSVQELSRELKVSHMTIRRDLVPLVDDELVKILHGSVILHPKNDIRTGENHYSLIAAGAKWQEQKRTIGSLAASLIEADDTLIIDSGSTTEYLAKCLPDDRHYTVLSWSLNILSETVRRKNCTSLFSGGIFHGNTLMFESPEGLDMIRRFRATKAFISSAGASRQFGVTCMNPYERETKMAAIQSSMMKILLVDSSKFGVVRSDYFADLSTFDEIITDSGISAEYSGIIRGLGITLRIA